MTRPVLLTTSAAFALAAGPALADLTADDVWASWQATAADSGQQLEVESLARAGERLTAEGITMRMEFPEGEMTTALSQIVFVEQGDGSVRIEVSETYDINAQTETPEGEAMSIALTLAHGGLDMVATGDPAAISYAIEAPSLELTLNEMTVDDEPVDMTLAVAIDALSGTYDVTGADPQTIASALSAGAVAFTMKMSEPEEGLNMSMSATLQGMTSTSTGTISPFATGADTADLLKSGLSTEGTAQYGASSYTIDVTTPDGQTVIDGSAEAGAATMSLGAGGLEYGGTATGVAMNIVAPGAMMPPVAFEIASGEGLVRMPLLASEEAQDFGLSMKLDGVSVGEMVWSMVDPTGGLPRDPANLELDLSGKGTWLVDVADPEALAELEAGMEARVRGASAGGRAPRRPFPRRRGRPRRRRVLRSIRPARSYRVRLERRRGHPTRGRGAPPIAHRTRPRSVAVATWRGRANALRSKWPAAGHRAARRTEA